MISSIFLFLVLTIDNTADILLTYFNESDVLSDRHSGPKSPQGQFDDYYQSCKRDLG